MVRAKEEGEERRRRDEEQAGWRATAGSEKASIQERKRRRQREGDDPARRPTDRRADRSSSSRRVSAPLPASRTSLVNVAYHSPAQTIRRSKSTASLSSSSKPSAATNPALKALHSKLSLASALKQDPFRQGGGFVGKSASPARISSSSSSAGSGVRVVKKT